MSLPSLSGPVRMGLLSLLAGVAYSVAAPQYAKACFAAPGRTGQSIATILEFVLFIPSVAFAIAGVVGLIVGTVTLIEEAGKR